MESSDRAARTFLVVLSDIRPELEPHYLKWYDEEHIPQRLAVPGFLSASRFEVGPTVFSSDLKMPAQPPPRHLAMYELTGPDVLESEPYRHLIANPSDWTKRIRSTFDLRLRAAYIERFRLSAGDGRVDPFR